MAHDNQSRETGMPMGYAEAVGIVLALAEANLPDDMDAAFGGGDMARQAEMEGMALQLLDSMADRFEALDASFPEPGPAGTWGADVLAADMDAAPTDPLEALKAALEMATNLPDEMCDALAVSVVSDLIGRHGAELASVLAQPGARPRA